MGIRVNHDNGWMGSTLWTRDASHRVNATLYLKVRFWAVPSDPDTVFSDPNDQPPQNLSDALPWREAPAGRLARFRERFAEFVSREWSDRFWLVPDGPWAGSRRMGDAVLTPNIACRLQLEFTERREDAHAWIRIFNVREWPEGVPRHRVRSHMATPRTTVGIYRSYSLWRGALTTGDHLLGGHTALHEVGHYLGLDHVNHAEAQRRGLRPQHGARYDAVSYGRGQQRGDLMGQGLRWDDWHAYPWCRRLRRHLTGTQPEETRWAGTRPLRWRTTAGLAPRLTDPDRIVTWTVTRTRPAPAVTPASGAA